jgi:hypothetical protein
MAKKLEKVITGNVLQITEGTTAAVLKFDSNELSDVIKANLSMHGLSQKLGDAAAGKEGEEAVKSINTVWEGLKKGDWTVRAPAGEKVSKKSIVEAIGNLSENEQKKAKDLLAKLGLKL